MNSDRRLDNSSSQHYIESEITMHQASLEAWVEATLVRSGKLNDGPSPWETQNPVPDFPSVRILIQEPRWYILSSLWGQLGLCGGSLNEDFGGIHFISMPSFGRFRHKKNQRRSNRILDKVPEPGGITNLNVTACCALSSHRSPKIRWDGANGLPALVYNNSHSI